MFSFSMNLKAETLQDYYNQLQDLKNQKQKEENQKKLDEKEYARVSAEIDQISRDIDAGRIKIKEAQQEVERLNGEIEDKKSEIDELLRFLQVTEGGNVYLEYVFGASDFTDFIFRSAVVEQLSDYNDKLIDEMNELIKENQKLQKDLKLKEEQLKTNQAKLQKNLVSLGNQIKSYNGYLFTVDEEIKIIEETVKYYESQGCKPNEDLSICVNMPYATSLVRPIAVGGVSSSFGSRISPLTGSTSFHYGIDLYNNEGTAIYPAASGIVIKTVYGAKCGGNQIFIKHSVNGVHYTTIYRHLLSIYVKAGDIVLVNDKIAAMGGGPSTMCRWNSSRTACVSGYDTCTTGAHLHFELLKGWYLGGDYSSLSGYYSNIVNPASYISFPSYFRSRY